jgi:hypothetical protein
MEQRSFRHQLVRGILVAAKPLAGVGAAALVAFGFYLQLDLRAPAEPHAPVASAGQAFTSADAPQVQTPPALAAQVPATPKTSHTLRPVPFILYDNQTNGKLDLIRGNDYGLSNIAATITNLLGYQPPDLWDPSTLEVKA